MRDVDSWYSGIFLLIKRNPIKSIFFTVFVMGVFLVILTTYSWVDNSNPWNTRAFIKAWTPSLFEDLFFFVLLGFFLQIMAMKDPKDGSFADRIGYLLNSHSGSQKDRGYFISLCMKYLTYMKECSVRIEFLNYDKAENIVRLDVFKEFLIESLARDHEVCKFESPLSITCDPSCAEYGKGKLGTVKYVRVQDPLTGTFSEVVRNHDILMPHKVWSKPFEIEIPANKYARYEQHYEQLVKVESGDESNAVIHTVSRITSKLKIHARNSTNERISYRVWVLGEHGKKHQIMDFFLDENQAKDVSVDVDLYPRDQVFVYFNL